MNGLSTADAAERLAHTGPNALPERVPDPLWRRFLRQSASPLFGGAFLARSLAETFSRLAWRHQTHHGVGR